MAKKSISASADGCEPLLQTTLANVIKGKRQTTTVAELARLLEVGEGEVKRMQNSKHSTKFSRAVEALAALGYEVTLTIKQVRP